MSRTVVIVDDHPSFRASARAILQCEGFDVVGEARAVLLPATMKLLGDWNWYLPRWLEWLPRLEHEPAPAAVPAPALPEAA